VRNVQPAAAAGPALTPRSFGCTVSGMKETEVESISAQVREMQVIDTHSGGCLCGEVRYVVSGHPAFGLVCHCRFCQRRLAGAFAVIAYFDERLVEFVQGTLTEYEHRSDESGRWLRMAFCGNCGTTVSHTAEVRPAMRAIEAGTFDDPDWFVIDRHSWVQSKRPWVSIPADVQVFQRGSVRSSNSRPAAASGKS